MPEPRPSQPNEVLRHITALDGIRGLAVLLVLIYHLLVTNDHTSSPLINLVVQFRNAAWIGVDLFFALSGFLITGILFDSLHERHFFRNFYARRVLRIFPLYYGLLLVLGVILFRSIRAEPQPFLLLLLYWQNTPIWFHLPQNTFFVELTAHLWSLAVEEQFYLVWPLIVLLVRRRRALLWISAAIFILALFSRILLLHFGCSTELTYRLTICRADSLVAGAWLALMLRGPSRRPVLRAAPAVFLAATAACCVIAWRSHGFGHELPGAVNLYGYTFLAFASSALIAMAVTPASVAARLFQLSPLRFLGQYSYGIYIVHRMLAHLLAVTLGSALKLHIHSKLLYHLASFVLVFAATLVVAWFSFHFYERPFLRLKRFFNYDRTPRTQATDSTP